ncbi:sugar transporter [Thozetella sp. PMI_491]|nr:sugar transporter [Thozetella sp. PMI_491]
MMDSEKGDGPPTVLEGSISQDKARAQHEEHATLGTTAETALTLSQAIKYYRKAILWSLTMSMATIMESYDLILLTNFFAFPQFQKKYGVQLPSGAYSIPTEWQVGFSMAGICGMIPGVFANGYLVDRYGYRKVMLWSHVAILAAIFIPFFAPSREVLLVGCLLLAFPCGIFAAATPGYASEITPMVLRGYLTTYVNLCWVIGHLIAAGVLISMLDNPTEWSYRIPFAIQWLWPPFLIPACYFAPESPWWLVKKGRLEDAEKELSRVVTAPEEAVNKKNVVAMIHHTLEMEKAMNIGGSYSDCFKGSNLRRTEIAMVSWGCQVLPGFAIQNYITYFFSLAGLSSSNSFKLALGSYSIAFVGTVSSWFLQKRWGRRDIYLVGLVGMFVPMATAGFIDLGDGSSTIRYAQAAVLLVWFYAYGSTVGPIPYAIAAEVGASRLRTKTISLGRNSCYFLLIINTIVAPYMLNPAAGNLKGKAAFPAAALTLILLVWAYFRLPETKNMTPETLDRLFHDRVPARKFKEEAKRYQ